MKDARLPSSRDVWIVSTVNWWNLLRKHPEAIPSAANKPQATTTSRSTLKDTNKQLAETGYTSETPSPCQKDAQEQPSS